MSAIGTAYSALAAAIARALAAAGFVTSADRVEIDPAAPVGIDGEGTSFQSAANLVSLGTAPTRTLIGGGRGPRYVVERQARLELAAAGPDPDETSRMIEAALLSLAPIGTSELTLGGVAERCGLLGADEDDLPPNGRKLFLTYFVRVRSGDPLGLTP